VADIFTLGGLDDAIEGYAKQGAIKRALLRAVKKGMRQAKKTMLDLAAREIKAKYPKLSLPEIKGAQNLSTDADRRKKQKPGWLDARANVKGNDFMKLATVLGVRNKRLSLTRLLVSPLRVQNQRGKSIEQRRRLKVQLADGKIKLLPHAFVQDKLKGGHMLVMERYNKGGKGSTGVYPHRSHRSTTSLTIKSPHHLFYDHGLTARILHGSAKKLRDDVLKNLKDEMRKLKDKSIE
jgi:hypothetical protein